MGVIEDTLAEIVSQFVAWVPNIVGVVIILLIGWGFKDAVAARAKDWIKSATQTAKKAEEVQAKKRPNDRSIDRGSSNCVTMLLIVVYPSVFQP